MRNRGDCHESFDTNVRIFVDFFHQRKDIPGGETALAGLFSDVDLQQNILPDALAGGLLVDSFQQPLGIHALDQIHLAHHEFDLVGLQMSDEMNRRAFIGVLRQLGGQLLNTVFSAAVHTGGNGLTDGVGVIHFGGGTELDGLGIPACGDGSGGHFGTDHGNIFSDRHCRILLSVIKMI